MTELCVLQKSYMILSFESGKMLSKFWPKSDFDQHLGPRKRLTKITILITFRNMQNVITISTNVIIMLAFCPIQKGVMLPVSINFEISHAWLRFKLWARPSRAQIGPAQPGPSHSLTTALAWPEILESRSRQLRPQLWYEFLRRPYSYYLENSFWITFGPFDYYFGNCALNKRTPEYMSGGLMAIQTNFGRKNGPCLM